MNLGERQKQFVDAVKTHYGATKQTKVSTLFGVSNSAKIIEGGIQLGVPNLDNATADNDSFILTCVLKFPPEDEVYFAVLIRSAKVEFLARLAEMKALGAAAKAAAPPAAAAAADDETEDADDNGPAASLKYSAKNNLVVAYIASADGKIYLRNAGFWSTLKMDLAPFGPAVEVDAIDIAVYPPAVSAQRSLLARDFVGYLGKMVGRERVHEQRVWTDSASVSPEMRRLPHTLAIADIEAAVTAAGGHYPGGEVRRYHSGLNFLPHKHFVILSGLSGTGKTRLALQYARAVHGLTDKDQEDPFLFVCAVRPEWTDPTGLTGYYDVLSNRYIVPPFLEAILLATAHPASPVFVVLDEMNLARVEYYFSDVLSAIETGEALQLHSNSVPLEGSTGTSIRAALGLPSNLYITGTINVDETTNPISDKVLDRAVVIDMSAVDLPGFLAGLEAREPALKDARAACEGHLLAAHGLMTAHGLGFGYRVTEEAVRYHAFAAEHLNDPTADTNDDLMVQKVLVKLRGAERQRQLLTGLHKALAGLPRSQAFITRLIADLDEFGSFQASR
jgi:5-methylcytosine-specific restriction protein B